MRVICILGIHKFDHCKCTICGKVRSTNHNFIHCTCNYCGTVREKYHNWEDDCQMCSVCGLTREKPHDWSANCGKCSKCNKTRDCPHDWSKNCEQCQNCKSTRENKHDLVECICSICGSEKHKWVSCFCENCDKVQTFTFSNLNDFYNYVEPCLSIIPVLNEDLINKIYHEFYRLRQRKIEMTHFSTDNDLLNFLHNNILEQKYSLRDWSYVNYQGETVLLKYKWKLDQILLEMKNYSYSTKKMYNRGDHLFISVNFSISSNFPVLPSEKYFWINYEIYRDENGFIPFSNRD